MVQLFWSAANISIAAYPGCVTGWLYTLSAEGRADLKTGMCLRLALQPENNSSFSYFSCFSVLRGARCELHGPWFDERSVAKCIIDLYWLQGDIWDWPDEVVLPEHCEPCRTQCARWFALAVESVQRCCIGCRVYWWTESPPLEEGAVYCAQHWELGLCR